MTTGGSAYFKSAYFCVFVLLKPYIYWKDMFPIPPEVSNIDDTHDWKNEQWVGDTNLLWICFSKTRKTFQGGKKQLNLKSLHLDYYVISYYSKDFSDCRECFKAKKNYGNNYLELGV